MHPETTNLNESVQVPVNIIFLLILNLGKNILHGMASMGIFLIKIENNENVICHVYTYTC